MDMQIVLGIMDASAMLATLTAWSLQSRFNVMQADSNVKKPELIGTFLSSVVIWDIAKKSCMSLVLHII